MKTKKLVPGSLIRFRDNFIGSMSVHYHSHYLSLPFLIIEKKVKRKYIYLNLIAQPDWEKGRDKYISIHLNPNFTHNRLPGEKILDII